MKVIIIGGVAAGASAAARLRRLDEQAEIVLLERGETISYANCGLPYHLGKVIPERENLLVMKAEKFRAWFRIDVRTKEEACGIDRAGKRVRIRKSDGTEYEETYDRLLLATGAHPMDSVCPGSDDPAIFHLWTLGDMDRILASLRRGATRALVVGGGFISLETAENLAKRGLTVTIVQRSHLLPVVDAEMSVPLARELLSDGIALELGTVVSAYERRGFELAVKLENGKELIADLVIVATGVRPNSELAAAAGLPCGKGGHITVDEHLRTADECIYAAGDAVEVVNTLSGTRIAVPLAGPANKQGRIAADNIAGGNSVYTGGNGTSVVKVGRLTAASTGVTEKKLKAAGAAYRKLYLHPGSNASYYPGSTPMHMKLIFSPDGTILGGQIVGVKGVDKRIDLISLAMRAGMKAPELAGIETAYAPPYGSAKDPVNFAGFIAEDMLNGLTDPVQADAIPADAVVLDVREPDEVALGAIPGAVPVRLGELRARLGELDRTKTFVTCCAVGMRGYLAERILRQNGFDAHNLSGGYQTWKLFHPEPLPPPERPLPPEPEKPVAEPDETVNVRALSCPGPVMKLRSLVEGGRPGARYHLLTALTFEGDLRRWAERGGHTLERVTRHDDYLSADVVQGAAASPVSPVSPSAQKPFSIVLFSNDLDKAIAAMILANGFAATGSKVNLFFTFWGLSVLRKDFAPPVQKDLISKMFGWMMPRGARKLALSKMNMLGIGSAVMKNVMSRKNVPPLPELIREAHAAGVRFIACEMAMDVMGLKAEELEGVDEIAGVATFASLAADGGTLFI